MCMPTQLLSPGGKRKAQCEARDKGRLEQAEKRAEEERKAKEEQGRRDAERARKQKEQR